MTDSERTKSFIVKITFSKDYSEADIKEGLEMYFDCLTYDDEGIKVNIKENKYEVMWKKLYKKYDGDLCYLPDTMDDIEKEYKKGGGK